MNISSRGGRGFRLFYLLLCLSAYNLPEIQKVFSAYLLNDHINDNWKINTIEETNAESGEIDTYLK